LPVQNKAVRILRTALFFGYLSVYVVAYFTFLCYNVVTVKNL